MPAAKHRPTESAFASERWRRYRRTGDRQARDQLIMSYAPIVKYVAGGMVARMPSHVELADLVSYGLTGLIDAVERFDPALGTPFEAYAALRVRGAILDQLRSLDWVPRAVREDARRIEDATAALTTRLQRAPNDAELATELAVAPEDLQASLQRVSDSRMVALDAPWGVARSAGAEVTLAETLPDHESVDPAEGVDGRDRRERIGRGIKLLTPREQTVLALRYQDELTFGQIGEVLGVSESRICQIHTKAALQMRSLLRDDDGGDELAPGAVTDGARARFERDA